MSNVKDEIASLISEAFEDAPTDATPKWFTDRIAKMGKKVAEKVGALETMRATFEREADAAKKAPAKYEAEIAALTAKLEEHTTKVAAYERADVYRSNGIDDPSKIEVIEAMYTLKGGDSSLADWLSGPAREHSALASFLPPPVSADDEGTPAAQPPGAAPAVAPPPAQRATMPRTEAARPVPEPKRTDPAAIKAQVAALKAEGKYAEAKAVIAAAMG